MINQEVGRLPHGTGLSPEVEPLTGLAGSAASIPSAGDWCIIASGRWLGVEHGETYAVGLIESVSPKKVRTASDVHYRGSHDRHLVTVCKDEQTARHLCECITDARDERNRLIRDARREYRSRADGLLASAMSAREGQDAAERLGATPASAVPQGDAPNSSPEPLTERWD